ncbi:MAG: hypothetical protein LBD93_02255 [Treponema sp.]|jgi:hypothetical protein|nr:hypothetical protein [Treponema sp.]
MAKHRGIHTFIKVITAGSIAFLVLTLCCFAYYNLPVHSSSKTGTTDYVWEKHAYYSKMTEGFGYGKMNNEGFNNLADYHGQRVDLLVMGSSQMEGTNVVQHKTAVALLNTLFDTSKYAYNIGISGHDFPHIVNNIERAIQYYAPQEYVIIETGSLRFDIPSLEDALTARMQRIPSYGSKILFYLQKIPSLRLLYSQYKSFVGTKTQESIAVSPDMASKEVYLEILNRVMNKLQHLRIDYRVNILIFYHPHLLLTRDGDASAETNGEDIALFKQACTDYGIYFVDMTDIFLDAYRNYHILPHGFTNTAVGVGHLNKNGHSMIANALFRQIRLFQNASGEKFSDI